MTPTKASIFIPTKNAGKEFRMVLDQISKQNEKNFEIIIVDSGSKDHTLKIAENFAKQNENISVQIHNILPKEFGHGKTRNLALKYSKAPYIVFLTQDAIPTNEYWLSHLLSNFKDPKVAGVFSRQIPKKNAREKEKFCYNYYFPDKKIIVPSGNDNLLKIMFFSNASSCIKKTVLQKYPFNETIIMTEDQEWAKKIIKKGYKKVYEPKSSVIHSHNYSLKQTFQRYFDSAVSINQILKKDFKEYVKYAKDYPIKELRYILRRKPGLFARLILENIIKIIATNLGKNGKIIPSSLKKIFSMHKYYWKV